MSKKSLAIRALKIGHYVHLPLGWVSHPFVLNSFLIKDQKQLDILQNLGLTTIVVDFERSKNRDFKSESVHNLHGSGVDDPDYQAYKAELARNQAEMLEIKKQNMKQQERWWLILNQARKNYQTSVIKLQEVYSKSSLQPSQAIEILEQLSGTIINLAEQKNQYGVVLCDTPTGGDLLYQNALNVAVLSAKLAIQLDYSRSECGLVIQIALLSNYGLLWVPESIRNKRSELSKPEINYMKQHPLYAKQKLQDLKTLPETVITCISQLHERLDGSGFPRALKGEQIHPHAQLVGAVTRYNEMCNGAFNCQRNSPHQVIAVLFKSAGKYYRREHIEQLVALLGLYPNGTLVKYDASHGQVQMNINGSLKKPFIMSLNETDEENKKPRLLDLTQTEVADLTPLTVDAIDEQYIEKFDLKNQYNMFYAIE